MHQEEVGIMPSLALAVMILTALSVPATFLYTFVIKSSPGFSSGETRMLKRARDRETFFITALRLAKKELSVYTTEPEWLKTSKIQDGIHRARSMGIVVETHLLEKPLLKTAQSEPLITAWYRDPGRRSAGYYHEYRSPVYGSIYDCSQQFSFPEKVCEWNQRAIELSSAVT